MKIAVLVSGGVDSSVALALLKQQNHDLTAFYLKIWLDDELAYLGNCPWEEDLSYVQAVCDQLQVPLKIMNLQREYQERVVAHAIEQIRTGQTPNPDIMCNQRIKFGLFLDSIDPSYEKVATGHYAQVSTTAAGIALHRSPDPIKDQSYFLARLDHQQLARALFPIGHLMKSDVRALAHALNLPNKDRKDSQGVCFLGTFKFRDFIKHHLGQQEGQLIEFETGRVCGTHQGSWFYTIGQRQGIRLAGGPWYVVSKDTRHNIVYISRSYYTPDKERKNVAVRDVHWLVTDDEIPMACEKIQVKMRHGPHLHQANVTLEHNAHGMVTLQEDDQGIAAGQYVVFYRGARCLGSALIT